MTPWLTLGTLQVELMQAPGDLTMTGGEDFAEHPRIGDLPSLQSVGSKTRELRFQFRLNQFLHGDVELCVSDVLAAYSARTPLDLVMGSGEVGKPIAGRYVLTDYTLKITGQADNGRWLEVELDVALREFKAAEVLEFKAGKAKAGAPGAKKTPPVAGKGPGYPTTNPYAPPPKPAGPKLPNRGGK